MYKYMYDIRPKIVTLIGSFQIVMSVITIPVILYKAYWHLLFLDVIHGKALGERLVIAQRIMLAMVLMELIISGLNIWIATAFLKGRKWSRWAFIILSFASMIDLLVTLATSRFSIVYLLGAIIQGAIFGTAAYSGEVKLFFDMCSRERRTSLQ